MERNVQELVKYWENVPGKMSIASEKDQYIKENIDDFFEIQWRMLRSVGGSNIIPKSLKIINH